MSELRQSTLVEICAEPYSQEELLALLVHSYRFSRGNPEAQFQFFDFLAANYGERISAKALEALQEPLQAIALVVVDNSPYHPTLNKDQQQASVEKDVKDRIREFKDSLKMGRSINIGLVCDHLVFVDHKWLPKDLPGRKYQPRSTKIYKSNLVKHALMGASTGSPEFDQMFSLVSEHYLFAEIEPRTKEQVDDLIKFHSYYNPQDRDRIRQRE